MTETLPTKEQKSAQLPPTWAQAKLSDILTIEYGKGLPKAQRNPEGNVPVYGSSGIAGYHDRPLNNNPCLVIGRKGAAGSVHLSEKPCWTIDTAYFVEPPDTIDLRYLFYLLRTAALSTLDKSTAVPSLSRNDAYSVSVAIAPTNEQHRIVEKIEELFTKLDAGVRSLEQARAQLKSYRRSVLRAAVEGELSREWREAHKDELEPASELLERILQERREKFTGNKYKEPAYPETSKLPTIPREWAHLSLNQASTHIVDCLHSTPKFAIEGKFCIDTTCIVPGKILFDRARKVSESTFEDRIRRLPPEENDVLFAREGTIGTAVLVPSNTDLCLGQRMMMFRPSTGVSPKFFMWALLSPMFEKQWKPRVVGTTAPHVNIRDLRMMAIPLPSLEEQRFLVEEVERRLSVVDKLEETVEASLKQANALRQSILRRAFAGGLVPQDPDDEPADVLLGRIRAERRGADGKGKRSRKAKDGDDLQGRLI